MDINYIAIIQAASAIIVMIATVFLVLYTRHYVKITNNMLTVNLKMNVDLLRPIIIIDMPIEDFQINLRIRNIGKRPAFNLSIQINPGMEDILLQRDGSKRKWENFNKALSQPSFTPGFELLLFITLGFKFLETRNKDKNYKYKIITEYFDYEGNKYNENYFIDLDALIDEVMGANFSQKYYIAKIEKHLEELKNMKL